MWKLRQGRSAGAGGQTQGGKHRVQGLPGLIPAAEGAEVPGGVIGVAVGQGKAGIRLPGKAHKGIALVVLEEDVVFGAVALDEGVFQHQRLKLTGDENRVEMIHLGDHLPGLGRVRGALLKILAHPVFQLLRLAHIDHFPGLVHHEVHAGHQRQIIGLLPQLFLCHGLLLSPLQRMEKKRLRRLRSLFEGIWNLIRRSCP